MCNLCGNNPVRLLHEEYAATLKIEEISVANAVSPPKKKRKKQSKSEIKANTTIKAEPVQVVPPPVLSNPIYMNPMATQWQQQQFSTYPYIYGYPGVAVPPCFPFQPPPMLPQSTMLPLDNASKGTKRRKTQQEICCKPFGEWLVRDNRSGRPPHCPFSCPKTVKKEQY